MSRWGDTRAAWLVATLILAAVLVPAGGTAVGSDGADPLLGDQWHLQTIHAFDAWRVAMGEGITIAVIDTGIDDEHEDLADGLVAQTECIGARGNPDRCFSTAPDDFGHGTHVAGVAMARFGNGAGGAGVAPRADLMAVKALRWDCDALGRDCAAKGRASDVQAAIVWAVDHGADIVNLSAGESPESRAASGTRFDEQIRYAWRRGVIVVVGAGNDGDTERGSGYGDIPAVVVTATGSDGQRARYATGVGDAKWGISAPGGEARAHCPGNAVYSTWPTALDRSGYRCMIGTSTAAPMVSGALAVMRSAGMSPREAVGRLLGSARDLGAPGPDRVYGYGLLDVARAVDLPADDAAAPSADRPAEPAPAPPPPSSTTPTIAPPSPPPAPTTTAAAGPATTAVPPAPPPAVPSDRTAAPATRPAVAERRVLDPTQRLAEIAALGLWIMVAGLVWVRRRRRT